ncbi:PTS sugar transporter subunit IIB [Oenococcus alcoholitolerans]|uniref:PTS sugar transporter subunit IIB n=1 Tax=Oenococcus alcoholitolerans TaxID=931074 RepID=UPI003F6E4C6F
MATKILLACAAGMSTSMLVARMQKAAEADGVDTQINATSAAEANEVIDKEHPDILLLGPQVRYMEPDFKKNLNIPVEVINMQDYGLMNGENVLRSALKTLGK